MRKSLDAGTFRTRAGIVAAAAVATAAVAFPGVAWADNAIPQGGPVVVRGAAPVGEASGPAVLGAALDAATCAGLPTDLIPAELQKLIAEGTAVPAVESTPAIPVDEVEVLTEEEVQRMIADGTITLAVPADEVTAEAPQMLTIQMDENAPAGTLAVTRVC